VYVQPRQRQLKPEKADTPTFGIVFTPDEALPGFQFSADYFKIEISDAIQQASTQRVLQGCRISGIQEFCDLITPDVPGDFSRVETIRALSFNGSGYGYKGIDFSATTSGGRDASSLNFGCWRRR
jgi:hypothetical protein